MDIQSFWRDALRQDENALPLYFHPDAVIRWHCTREIFSVAEFVRVNCEYPGRWQGEVERVERVGDRLISAVRVISKESGASFHVVNFMTVRDGKIAEMDEYWSDDTPAPEWRQKLHIGKRMDG